MSAVITMKKVDRLPQYVLEELQRNTEIDLSAAKCVIVEVVGGDTGFNYAFKIIRDEKKDIIIGLPDEALYDVDFDFTGYMASKLKQENTEG